MPRTSFMPDLRCVEPVQRMVGGRFGWAYHRFQIKGGITRMQASRITWAQRVIADADKAGFFTRMLSGPAP